MSLNSHLEIQLSNSWVQNSVITQGIAARLARRQASSEKAGMYVERTPQLAGIAWKWVTIPFSPFIVGGGTDQAVIGRHIEMSERERKKEGRAGGKL